MALPPDPAVFAQLLSRALDGSVALAQVDLEGRVCQLETCAAGRSALSLGLALPPAALATLRDRGRAELELRGERWTASGAVGPDQLLWVFLRPPAEPLRLGRFTQHLVHALRNALSSIKLAVQLAGRSERLDAREKKRLTIALREMTRVERILSTASELVRPPLPREESTLASAQLREAVDRIGPELEARGVTVELEVESGLAPLGANPLRLRLAFEDLLLSCARAMAEGGALTAALGLREGVQCLELHDQGPPLQPEESSSIFAPLAPGVRGSGLDLALVAQVAAELGGSIAARNAPAGGVIFTMSLGTRVEDVHGHPASGR